MDYWTKYFLEQLLNDIDPGIRNICFYKTYFGLIKVFWMLVSILDAGFGAELLYLQWLSLDGRGSVPGL